MPGQNATGGDEDLVIQQGGIDQRDGRNGRVRVNTRLENLNTNDLRTKYSATELPAGSSR